VELGSHPLAPFPAKQKPRPLVKRPLLWILIGLGAMIVFIAALFTAAVPLSSDTLRDRIVRTLSDKLDSEVELGSLQLRAFPALRAEGTDLRIRRHGASGDYPPLIVVKSFHVDASIAELLAKHVDHVQLSGLTITIAPKAERVREHEVIAR